MYFRVSKYTLNEKKNVLARDDDERKEFEFGGFSKALKQREREREREKEDEERRRRGDILKLSLSLSLSVVVVVVVISSSSSSKPLFLRYYNTHGFLSPKEEKAQILLLGGESWKSDADETVRGGETVETSIRSRERERERNELE